MCRKTSVLLPTDVENIKVGFRSENGTFQPIEVTTTVEELIDANGNEVKITKETTRVLMTLGGQDPEEN